jgi:CubicO group peptidase (beta-lactamase class C family)
VPLDPVHVYARNLEVPAGGGVGTARALARAYGVFATGGRELGLRHSTLQALMAPAVPPARGFFDESLKYEWQLSLGFVKPSGGGMQFGSPSAFGMPGWGGALAYADPEIGAGYAYVTNRMGTAGADPREIVAPICTDIPFETGTDLDNGRVAQTIRDMRMAMVVNALGLPAVAVLVGIADGLPQAVQVIGPRYREDLCLDAAAALEDRLGIITPIDPR